MLLHQWSKCGYAHWRCERCGLRTAMRSLHSECRPLSRRDYSEQMWAVLRAARRQRVGTLAEVVCPVCGGRLRYGVQRAGRIWYGCLGACGARGATRYGREVHE